MKRTWDKNEERYFGIGIYQPKTSDNIGTLWRTAYLYGASYIFVIDAKYKKGSSDIMKVWSKIPLLQFETLDAFLSTVPYSCKVVGLENEKDSIPVKDYVHPDRAIYILGSEDNGLPNRLKERCHDMIKLPGEESLNVAVAGSIAMFDRINKLGL